MKHCSSGDQAYNESKSDQEATARLKFFPLTLAIHRLHNRLCVGTTGIVVKSIVALVALVVIYIIGYVTGYYVHRC